MISPLFPTSILVFLFSYTQRKRFFLFCFCEVLLHRTTACMPKRKNGVVRRHRLAGQIHFLVKSAGACTVDLIQNAKHGRCQTSAGPTRCPGPGVLGPQSSKSTDFPGVHGNTSYRVERGLSKRKGGAPPSDVLRRRGECACSEVPLRPPSLQEGRCLTVTVMSCVSGISYNEGFMNTWALSEMPTKPWKTSPRPAGTHPLYSAHSLPNRPRWSIPASSPLLGHCEGFYSLTRINSRHATYPFCLAKQMKK